MCTVCQMTGSFDPARHGEDWSLAQFSEGTDAAAGTGTIYTMAPGDSFLGQLGVTGDRDWVAVTLDAGQSYDIALSGFAGGGGTLGDAYLRIHDATGSQVAQNDDGGAGLDSALTFTANATGTYYLSAGGFDDGETGTYTLTISTGGTSGGGGSGAAGTLDQLADYLVDGYWNDGRRAFDTSADANLTVNLTALTAEGQQLARWALEAWEMVADLRFTEVTGRADIDFDDDEQGAFAESTYNSNGVISSANVNVDASWIAAYGAGIGSYSFSTYIHEIGHALGLGHQGGYNGTATYPNDATFANDSYQLSIMSYFSQTDNTSVNASYAEPVSAMMADIIAIQNLYGAPGESSATAGNTVWGRNGTLGTYMDDYFSGSADYDGEPVTYAIYDLSGTDLLDVSFSTTNDRLDLTAESISDLFGLIGNVTIARDTVIENARTGSGNDAIQGNSAANDLRTGLGNDTLRGGDNNDQLFGGAGEDSLFGDFGHDRIVAGSGNDTAYGGVGNDRLFGGLGNDSFDGGGGSDVLYGNLGDDYLYGGANAFSDTLYGGSGDDTLDGGDAPDFLYGQAGHDSLIGGSNNDVLDGGWGEDTLLGGEGLDTLIGGPGNDVLSGGANLDTFVFGTKSGDGRVTDFQNGLDLLDVSALGLAGFGDVVASDMGGSTLIDLDAMGGEGTIVLDGFAIASLDAADFVF